MFCCKKKKEVAKGTLTPNQTYDPEKECQTGRSYQEALFEQHWQEARSLKKQKMWITGLYFAGFAYVFSGNIAPESKAVLAFLSVAGFAAFFAVYNLQYLCELHMAKAQVYVAGERRGVIFNFKIDEPTRNEDENALVWCGVVNCLLCLFNLTTLYSWLIFNSTLYCCYRFILLCSKSEYQHLLGTLSCGGKVFILGLVLLITYLLIRILLNCTKRYARRQGRRNLSQGWHKVKPPRSEHSPAHSKDQSSSSAPKEKEPEK